MNTTRAIGTGFEPFAIRPTQGPWRDPVAMLLRAEALVELALAVWAYRALGGGWLIFAGLFLVPDFSMAGYLIDRRIGAHAYNLAHNYVAPAVLALGGFVMGTQHPAVLSLVWAAHIGFDRVLGFGLKYTSGFGDTHLKRQ
jgi:uncharacterized SAM-binding protein YcdF (DUF218 family)